MSEKLVTGDMQRLPGLTPHVEAHQVAPRGTRLERGSGMRLEPGMIAQAGRSAEPVAVYHPIAKNKAR